MKTHYIGYWNNDKNMYPEFNIPKQNTQYNNSKEIEMIQLIFDNSHPMYCKGSSTCRCCSQMNGSVEYKYQVKNDVYIIPEGYLHYIQEHYIPIDEKINHIFNLILKKKNY